MKKIHASLVLPVIVLALIISIFLFKDHEITEEKPLSGEEQLPAQAHTVNVDSSSEENDYDKSFSAIDLQVEDLRRQVDLLSKKLRESDQKAKAMESEKTPDEIPSELNATEIPADEAVYSQFEEQKVNLTARLMQEPVDKQWAEETINALEDAVETNEALAGIELMQATCGSTLCKLEINVGQNRPAEEIMQKLSIHRTWKGPTTFAVNDSGHAEIIFARDGHSLE
jgi:hypothetical protein